MVEKTRPADPQASILSVAQTASDARDLRARELASILDETALRPIEPRNIDWNVFELFGLEANERAWTRWLAGILDARQGMELAACCWRALCGAACEALTRKTSEGHEEQEWWTAQESQAPSPGQVHPEYVYPGLGIVDLFIETPVFVMVIENKLWEDWHDWSDGSRQADRYRRIASQMARDRASRLILLSANEDLEYIPGESPGQLQVPCDYLWISYSELARALRIELSTAVTSPDEALALWPALLTVTAIERCIFDVSVPSSSHPATWKDLRQLTKAVSLRPRAFEGAAMTRAHFDEVGLTYARNLEAVEASREQYESQRDSIAKNMLARMKEALPKGRNVLNSDTREGQTYRELYVDGDYADFRGTISRGSEKDAAGFGFMFDVWDTFDSAAYGLSAYLFFRMESASFRAIRSNVEELVRQQGDGFSVEHGDGYVNVCTMFIPPDSDRFEPVTFERAVAELPGYFSKMEQPILRLYKELQVRG